jgi:hypothetical protein
MTRQRPIARRPLTAAACNKLCNAAELTLP